MCESCGAEIEDHGEFLPGWKLIRATCNAHHMKAGDWGLETYNGPSFIWNGEIKGSPIPQEKEDDDIFIEEHWEEESEFLRCVCNLNEGLQVNYGSIVDAWSLVDEAQKHGYRINQAFGAWLLNHLAEHIENRK